MEVQSHGVAFEDEVILAITGVPKKEYQLLIEGAYVASLDIFKGIRSDKDYSIKVTGGKGIGCGDIIRFMKHCKDTDFTMIVGCWKQQGPKKIYREIYEFHFTPDLFKTIWGEITLDVIKPFVDYVKSIPEGKEAQMANRKEWKHRRAEIFANYSKGLASIDAKIDSKNQRRVQCSLSLDGLIEHVPYVKYTKEYNGIKLPYEQESGRRTFS